MVAATLGFDAMNISLALQGAREGIRWFVAPGEVPGGTGALG